MKIELLNQLLTQPNGCQEWWKDDELHRGDGPAVLYPDGEEHWYINGLRHRIGGPAITYSNGEKHWYEHGKFIKKEVSPFVNLPTTLKGRGLPSNPVQVEAFGHLTLPCQPQFYQD